MYTVLTMAVFFGGAFGVYMLAMFLMRKQAQEIHELEIVGFQKVKNKGRFLPTVRYEDKDGKVHLVDVKVINQISYLLSPPIERQIIPIVGVVSKKPRVSGYLQPVLGVLLVLPVLALLGMGLGREFFVGQVTYVLILAGLMLGGLAVMQYLKRHY